LSFSGDTLTPKILGYLENLKPGYDEEIQLMAQGDVQR